MREILFRGQTRKKGQQVWMDGTPVDGQWVYGGIFQGTGDYSIIYGAEKEHFTGADLDKYAVYSDTVGQYTGLKDINGKMIFEGDIIESQGCRWVVGFENAAFAAMDGSNIQFAMFEQYIWHYKKREWEAPDYFEVIGNIYDNPELLEVQNERI